MKLLPFSCKMLCFACSFLLAINSQSQVVQCPANINFEYGDFTNWECYTGSVFATAGINTVTFSGASSSPTPNRMEIIGPSDNSTDPIGGFPRRCPNGSSYSIKLGNEMGGHEAEGISYTYTIPANATKFSLIYNYAIVMQSPNHPAEQQPRFRARIVDAVTGEEINCVSFDFTSSGSLPGFQSVGGAVFKDWTPISVDLSAFAGRTIRLEFITSDCTLNQHFGYAYIDVNSDCSGTIKGSTFCQGDSVLKLTAPYGYQSYAWYGDNTFSQVVNTTQELQLNTSTLAGSVFPVIVNPYPGFGCLDTLYAVISIAQKPVAVAGPDQIVCSKVPVQVGGTPNPDYIYAWTPANLVQNATLGNPYILTPFTAPAQLILQTTDAGSGCFSYDTVQLTPRFVDTASSYTGNLIFCPSDAITTTLTVENAGNQVQWLKENAPVASATNPVFKPTTIGNYRAKLTQGACVDTTRVFQIRYAPFPEADFTLNKEIQCNTQPVEFSNTTTISGNEAVHYRWQLSDGFTAQTEDLQRVFAIPGIYRATLIATSGANCIDSISKAFTITTLCTPMLPSAFTPNGDGRNERFTPFMAGARSLRRFTIYSRFGKAVFTTEKEKEGWDGKINGTPAQSGVYVWMLDYISADGKFVTDKGTVMLIR